jgi:hypothetical protein
MTGKADFTEQEWELMLSAAPLAGLIVVTAAHGGTFKESFAIGKAYGEARKQHGSSQLLDEIVTTRPKVDHTRFGSFDELKQHGLERLREVIALLEAKATPQEVDDYRRFVLAVAQKVAEAHREDDVAVSDPERAAIGEIEAALGGPSPGAPAAADG